MARVEIKMKPNGMDMGQEQEKSEISQIKEMAMQISNICDSLMEREEEEDMGNEDTPSIEDKAEYVRNFNKR